MENYVNFDRQDIGQTSLAEALSCLSRIHGNKHLWKYAIISIHNALQCYLSIALRGGSGIDTWKKSHAKKWLKAYDECVEKEGLKALPDVQLDYFMELYDKLFTNKPSEERGLINWLNETRNEFIHFNSDSFAVDELSMLAAFTQALEDIQETQNLSNGIFFYNDEQKDAFTSSFNELTYQLEKLNKSMQPTANAAAD
ncbi:MAG: hypothetical protein Q7K57_36880 [Burkholderiaceae bacterium]|nr:hypothetical protein [Burkholderiaceae bacterium]